MAIFNDVVNLWKSDDLLSQAWKESYNMIRLSNKIFEKAVFFLREGGEKTEIKALKKRDQEINNFQMDVRKKVITHFAVSNDLSHLPNGLVLLSVVVDIERVGDYTKNILDLAMNHPKKIISEKISSDLHDIEQEIIGKRPGEKIHEQMISKNDSYSTYEYSDYYKILPQINEWGKDNLRIKDGVKVSEGFTYSSDNNREWMTKDELQSWIVANQNFIGKI